jgi:hypothetical protein
MSMSNQGPMAQSLLDAVASLARNTRLITQPGGVEPVTRDDLYELLFVDPQVSAEPRTTHVAQAIASVQQYINSVYNGMEPGYSEARFDPEDVEYWQNIESRFDIWAANQMVEDYPENFIDPSLRIKRTSLFKTLESNLNQTRLTEDSVHSAIKEYLRAFQETCDMEVLSGYIDRSDFKDATYYFIGRERTPPYRYFWRKARIDVSANPNYVNPTAWGEWQSIDIPLTETMLDIRPVFWRGRLSVVWASWAEALTNDEGQQVEPARLDVLVSFVTISGQWSAPVTLHQSQYDKDFEPLTGRLVAVVFAEQRGAEDKLAVCFTGVSSTGEDDDGKPSIYEIRDTLFRKRPNEAIALLELAHVRFKDRDTLQYSVMPQERISLTVDSRTSEQGDLNEHLKLEVTIARELVAGTLMDVLRVRGTCDKNLDGREAMFKLQFTAREVEDPEPWTGKLNIDGNLRTPWMEIKRSIGLLPINEAIPFVFGAEGHGRNAFDVKLSSLSQTYRVPKLHRSTDSAAQFLDFNNAIAGQTFRYTRLNTLIGPQLVARADISVAAVLDWTTQHLPEPALPDGAVEINGPFDGSNGLYFWELFFHLVHMVTHRLRNEGRFLEAQRWSHYLFDPQLKAQSFAEIEPGVPDAPDYWRCRPLNLPGDIAHELASPNDPDAIAYGKPRHYQIALFMGYVRTLIEWGDWLYRQLTRDSLAAAQLHYLRAQSLMGEAPEFGTANDWVPQPIEDLIDKLGERQTLREFEQKFVLSADTWPQGTTTRPRLEMLGVQVFRAPLNQEWLNTYREISQRMFNLRHYLTLDGKPLSLPLYAPPADPRELLRAQAAGTDGLARRMGGQLVVPPYRFRTMLEMALRAVETHARFGEQLRLHMEQRDRGQQEELQQTHLIELGAFAENVQKETISQLQEARNALLQTRGQVQARLVHFEQLSRENVSVVEYEVMDQILASKIFASTGSALNGVGAIIDTFPNIFGVANGGHQMGSPVRALGYGMQVISEGLLMDADRMASSEQYRRRQQDWNFNSQQARLELQAMDQQLLAHDHSISAATASLRQTETASAQAQALYTFYKQERLTTVELSSWMLGQMKNLYFPAHDAVISLCQTVETCMRYETGDYDTKSFIRPEVWMEKYHGLTAAESLKLDLLLLESEYLKRHERRLELVKTVSLRQLFDNPVHAPDQDLGNWRQALAVFDPIEGEGSLNFNLTQKLFDLDYPGHYCRQIISVSVSLPVLVGPYQDVRATLVQRGSHTLTKPLFSAVQFMHGVKDSAAGPDIKINVRNSQQICVSTGLDDNGMVVMATDDRYLPFEGTGAVSTWTLSFPRHGKEEQASMLATLNDIIVTVRYLARDGGRDLAREVEKLLAPSKTTP